MSHTRVNVRDPMPWVLPGADSPSVDGVTSFTVAFDMQLLINRTGDDLPDLVLDGEALELLSVSLQYDETNLSIGHAVIVDDSTMTISGKMLKNEFTLVITVKVTRSRSCWHQKLTYYDGI